MKIHEEDILSRYNHPIMEKQYNNTPLVITTQATVSDQWMNTGHEL